MTPPVDAAARSGFSVGYARMSTPEEYRAYEEARHREYVAIGIANARTSTILCVLFVAILAIAGWAIANGHAGIVAWSAFAVLAVIACGFAIHAWVNWRDAIAHERAWQRRPPQP